MDIQLVYKYVIVFLYAFFATYWATPVLMKKLIRHGFLRPDKYKRGNKQFVTMAGISILVGILVSLSLSQVLITSASLGRLFIFYFVVIVYALYGLSDDMFGSGDGVSVLSKRYDKILVILILSFPIASLITDTNINFFNQVWEFGLFFTLLLAPIYIMVVANLINLHAGYNGLATGTSWILLFAILVEAVQRGQFQEILFILPVFGALSGFLPYNIFPAKAHDANVGAFLVGGAIGASLLALNLEIFGIFILIPHIINFCMDTWTLVIRKKEDVRFGTLRKNNTIIPPPTMKFKSLKFLICSWWPLKEQQATTILWAFTALFCGVGILIF